MPTFYFPISTFRDIQVTSFQLPVSNKMICHPSITSLHHNTSCYATYMPMTLEQIVSFCKRRGFVYLSSEIYGGFSAVYDFGPYGAELAKNLRNAWWQAMVQFEDDIVGLDSSIFMLPQVWVASGHVGGFSDPLAECKECHTRSRVDHLLESIGVFADEKMTEEQINALLTENKDKVTCPHCGNKNFTEAKSFNLLVKSNLGNFTGNYEKEPTYLRGETCQGIYVNFKNVLDSSRVKVPFGIAQIGKAFRNEITARQFIFRKREFEQMEMQYFIHPSTTKETYERWKQKRMNYYIETLKFNPNNLRWHEHENLVFYASAAFDIEYNFPFGFKELEGIHARGDYDLTQHMKHSGKNLQYRDPHTNEEYTPHIVETSVGLDRTFLAVLTEFLKEETLEDGSVRTVFAVPYNLAPVKVAVMPLLKNKEHLVQKAHELFKQLSRHWQCEFDASGNIGKSYRRQDEIGTPFCITVDFETLGEEGTDKDTVTVRNRDTLQQERVHIDNLVEYINKFL
jgi:glycyl-tRNA synthetase